jgi:hypothetical protein
MRIATSQDFPADGLVDIHERWSFRDLYEAHLVQDYMDLMREKAHESAKSGSA